jgi:hypothetical protein
MKQLSQNAFVSKGRYAAAAVVLLGVASAGCGGAPTPAVQTAADHANYVESTRCVGVEPGQSVDTVLSGQAVIAVRPLYAATVPSKSDAQDQLHGAIVTVTAQPGMTAEWLDRVLECHSADETLGRTADRRDPFYLPDAVVDITVKSAKDGFAIDVSTFSPGDGQRILDRANAWAPSRAPAVSLR